MHWLNFYCFSNNDTLISYMRRYRKFRQGVGVWMGSISDNIFLNRGEGIQLLFNGVYTSIPKKAQ